MVLGALVGLTMSGAEQPLGRTASIRIMT